MNKSLLITRGIVVYPTCKKEIEIGREKSLNSINFSVAEDKKIIVVSQKDPSVEDPSFNDVYVCGTLCSLSGIVKHDDGSLKVSIRGLKRIKILGINEKNKTLFADYEEVKEVGADDTENINQIQMLYSLTEKHLATAPTKDITSLKNILTGSPTSSKIVDQIAGILTLSLDIKQQILEEVDVGKRIQILLQFVGRTEDKIKIEREISKSINDALTKQQREFYLRENLRVVKEKLGEVSSKEEDVNILRKKVNNNPYPDYIKKRALSEINKMEAGNNPQENSMNRAYVEWLLDLPWWQTTTDINDIKKVAEKLNESHYGLEKVKERIIEYLAVRTKSPNSKAPIICLVGPPGVGKSTLARSIAEALGKKFVKMALGGVRDESEIRGHRKTYIGSMPGRVIKAMKQAGVVNPLFLLDELDKMTSDMRGDPASAMLEILDAEQNGKFSDNYIEEDYDLSKVMFVATANYAEHIPAPLYDRLEIIELTSYTEREKLEIGKKYLVNKIAKDSGLKENELQFTDEGINYIIQRYTREAGVRELERLIQKITRKFIVRQQHDEIKTQTIGVDEVKGYLKNELFEYNVKDHETLPGVVNGMAYTTAGGDLLPIEVTSFNGKGNIVITGNLKETMKESASVALGYVKANAEKFGIKDFDFSKIDIHIHVPSGGIPKDGPSAGVTLTTAIISALSKRAVPNNIAMTGEITLRGKVLIIGGVKEKVISAFRGGVNEVFMPKADERYIEDIPVEVRDKITFNLVESYCEIYQKIFK